MKYCIARAHGGIGDILMMTPGIHALKKAGHEVSVAIDRHRTRNDTYFNLLKNNTDIKFIYDYRYVNKRKFDKCIDITSIAYKYEQAGLKISRAEIFAKAMGVEIETEKPFYSVEKGFKIDNSVALHFFATEKRRSWSLKKANLLIEWLLNNTNCKIILLDKNKDLISDSKKIIYCGDLTVEEASKYVAGCDYFVGVDSGWMHIAGALDIPGLALFGSTDPITRIKDYTSLESVYSNSTCRGCFYKQCDLDYDCMKKISLLEVVERLKSDALLL